MGGIIALASLARVKELEIVVCKLNYVRLIFVFLLFLKRLFKLHRIIL